MRDAIALALLVVAAATALWFVAGFLRAPDALARLHYLTPVSTVATFAVALALAIDGPDVTAAIKAGIVFVVTAVTSPITQHKIAHAIWVRRQGRFELPEEAPR